VRDCKQVGTHQTAGSAGEFAIIITPFAGAAAFTSAPPFLPMAASLVITKEEIEIFIYQQRAVELVSWENCARAAAGRDFQSAPK